MHKNLSSRSELLVQARGKISNPFLLCAVIGERTRELMMGPNKDWSTAELVDYAFSELLAGVLEFEMQGEKQPKSKAPLSQNYPNAASIEVLEVEAR